MGNEPNTNALDDLLNSLNTEDASDTDSMPPATEENTEPNEQPETPDVNDSVESTTDNAEGTTEDTATEGGLPGKANQAFAQMRVQNKQFETVLSSLLTKLGVDPTLARDPTQVQELLDNATTVEQAKAMNVPTELLSRLTQLERANQQQEQQRLTNLALQGFKEVQAKYKLTDKEIGAFATQLQNTGTNPFESEMDLDMAYRTHNIDKIIQSETQRAVEAALKRQADASNHSTTPAKSNGKSDTSNAGDSEINTMSQFDSLLRSIK